MYFTPDLTPGTYIKPLQEVIKELNPQNGLEIGFCWGMSAYAYLTSCGGSLLSIDLNDNKNKEAIFREQFGDRWDIMYGDSKKVLLDIKQTFDWVYIDGEHTYEACKTDLNNCLPLCRNVIACDDYGRPTGAKQAIDEFVIEHPEFKVYPIDGHVNGAVILRR